MTTTSVSSPYPIFNNSDGLPLSDGYIYIGEVNLNPEAYQKTAYWDEALTITAAQPIRTINGYPSRSGSPARIYVDENYSIVVKNKIQSTVYSSLSTTDIFSQSNSSIPIIADQIITASSVADFITLTGLTNNLAVFVTDANHGGEFVYDTSILKTAHNGITIYDPSVDMTTWTYTSANSGYGVLRRINKGVINVKWANAKGDGAADDLIALQACLELLGEIYFPEGSYAVSASLVIKSYTHLKGNLGKTKIIPLNAAYSDTCLIKVAREINALWTGYFAISDIYFENTETVYTYNAISFTGAVWEWVLTNVKVTGFGLSGILLDASYRGVLINCGVYSCGLAGSQGAVQYNDLGGTDRCSNIKWVGGQIQDTPAGVRALVMYGGTGNTFDTTVFQSNGYGVRAFGTANLSLNNCYMEDLDREITLEPHAISGAPCKLTQINTCQLVRDGNYALPVILNGDEDTLFNNCLAGGNSLIYLSRAAASKRTRIVNSPQFYFSDSLSSTGFEKTCSERFIGAFSNGTLSVTAGTPTFNSGFLSVVTDGTNTAVVTKAGKNKYIKNNIDVEVVCSINDVTNTNFRPINIETGGSLIRLSCSTAGATNNFTLEVNGNTLTSSTTIGYQLATGFHSYRLRVSFNKIEVFIDGILLLTYTDTAYIPPTDTYLQLSSYNFSPTVARTMSFKSLELSQDFRS